MRANNEFVSSNWSDAYEIPLSSMGTGCGDLDVSTAGIVAGSLVGGMVLVTLLTCCMCVAVWYIKMLRRRKKLRRITEVHIMLLVLNYTFSSNICDHLIVNMYAHTHTHWLVQEFVDPVFRGRGSKTVMRNPTDTSLKSPMDEWEIPASEVIMEKLLGEGAFGEVYKGIVKCPIVNPKVRPLVENAFCTPVAIKLLKCKKYITVGKMESPGL